MTDLAGAGIQKAVQIIMAVPPPQEGSGVEFVRLSVI
jgi:hypothetical protein